MGEISELSKQTDGEFWGSWERIYQKFKERREAEAEENVKKQFDGEFDHAAIFNRCLTTDEIHALYSNKPPKAECFHLYSRFRGVVQYPYKKDEYGATKNDFCPWCGVKLQIKSKEMVTETSEPHPCYCPYGVTNGNGCECLGVRVGDFASCTHPSEQATGEGW